MGIWHFAGLGTSPGAVSVGLSFIQQQYQDKHFGKPVEGIVLFTSPEVASGELKTRQVVLNRYGTIQGNKEWDQANTVDVIKEFVLSELSHAELHLVAVNVNDYDDCFEAIARTTLKYRIRGSGKHIWANVTGGTNVLNTAVAQVACLTGYLSRGYYTFVQDRSNLKYLRPFTDDPNELRYQEILFPKTQFDQRQMLILMYLATQPDWITGEALLSCLQQEYSTHFHDLSFDVFKRDYLNLLEGDVIEEKDKRRTERKIRITDDGQRQLELMESTLFQRLVLRQNITEDEINAEISALEIERLL